MPFFYCSVVVVELVGSEEEGASASVVGVDAVSVDEGVSEFVVGVVGGVEAVVGLAVSLSFVVSVVVFVDFSVFSSLV